MIPEGSRKNTETPRTDIFRDKNHETRSILEFDKYLIRSSTNLPAILTLTDLTQSLLANYRTESCTFLPTGLHHSSSSSYLNRRFNFRVWNSFVIYHTYFVSFVPCLKALFHTAVVTQRRKLTPNKEIFRNSTQAFTSRDSLSTGLRIWSTRQSTQASWFVFILCWASTKLSYFIVYLKVQNTMVTYVWKLVNI